MGYFFTLLYLLTAYLTPRILFGPLAAYHVEIIVALLAIVTSIPKISSSGLGRAPQTLALAGLAFAIAASIAQTGWLGGVLGPLYGFSQPAMAFFLVAINFRRKSHFSWLVMLLIAASIFFMIMGIRDLRGGIVPSPYLYGDEELRRLRGLGFVNDPNDFAQVLVALVPCVFLWRKKILVLDVFLLGIPLAVLFTAMYLTHSRGGMLAIAVVILLSARSKIGTIPAAVIAGSLATALLAFGWSGGRDISMDAGADRLDLWYDGMQALKSRPLFGIGLDRFSGVYGITAHNSVIICASELGVVGLFFWTLFLFSTVRSVIGLGSLRAPGGKPELSEGSSSDYLTEQTGPASYVSLRTLESATKRGEDAEYRALHAAPPAIDHWQNDIDITMDNSQREARDITYLLLISLAGMLTAGWFLSRALSMWLFMYCGMVYAASQMNALGEDKRGDKLSFLIRWSAAVTAMLIAALYVILRARNVLH